MESAPDGKIIKADVSIAKNYLNDKEISYLERIVSLYLDYAELQAERQIPMSMEDWAKRLDGFLEFNGNELLIGAGKVGAERAKLHAETGLKNTVLCRTDCLSLITISFYWNWMNRRIKGMNKLSPWVWVMGGYHNM